jgi:hypothetical protein
MSHKVIRYTNFLLFSLIKMARVDFSAFGMSIFFNPIKCMKILECEDFEINNTPLDI